MNGKLWMHYRSGRSVTELILTISFTNALELAKIDGGPIDDKIRNVLTKYMEQIPDITDKYVVDERISRAISKYFKGKISTFPLFKVSLKIDRNPVRIPWALDRGEEKMIHNKNHGKKANKHVRKLIVESDQNVTRTTSASKLGLTTLKHQ